LIEYDPSETTATTEQLAEATDQELVELHAELYDFIALVRSQQARRRGYHGHPHEDPS
jgi:hypothetical protein